MKHKTNFIIISIIAFILSLIALKENLIFAFFILILLIGLLFWRLDKYP